MYTNFQLNNVQVSFLSQPNVQFIQQQVSSALSAALGRPVTVPLDDNFRAQLGNVVANSQGPVSGLAGLALMNRTTIQRLIDQCYGAAQEEALYQQYFIEQDRPFTMDYGAYTGGSQVTVSPSNYLLSHPWQQQQATYLDAVINPCVRDTTFAMS